MADARRKTVTKRAGRTDADENGGRSIDDESSVVQRAAEGDEEEMTPDEMAEVGATAQGESIVGASEDAEAESVPDSTGSERPRRPAKGTGGSEKRGGRG